MNDPITIQTLGTVIGASIAAGIIVQFVRIFWRNLDAQGARMLAATSGLATVLAVTVATGVTDPTALGLAAIVGLQAGLAASKVYEIGVDGINHDTNRR